jgi:hypothetical protein
MALTERQRQARQGKLTGSRIGALMSGDPAEMYDLWLELTGDPEGIAKEKAQRLAFENQWHIQLGARTEKLHLDWLQRTLDKIDCRGDVVMHKTVPWAAVTLDGWCKRDGIAVEAKHVGGFEPMEVLIDRYMPQLHWTMNCTSTREIYFSAIMGAKEPKPIRIKQNDTYMATLIEQAVDFMDCVFNLREPTANPYIKPPKPEYAGVVDMTGSNVWATAASRWKENMHAHKAYEFAAKEIKAAVPADAKEAFGHGIRAKRSKTGALTIKLETEDNGPDEGNN